MVVSNEGVCSWFWQQVQHDHLDITSVTRRRGWSEGMDLSQENLSPLIHLHRNDRSPPFSPVQTTTVIEAMGHGALGGERDGDWEGRERQV